MSIHRWETGEHLGPSWKPKAGALGAVILSLIPQDELDGILGIRTLVPGSLSIQGDHATSD